MARPRTKSLYGKNGYAAVESGTLNNADDFIAVDTSGASNLPPEHRALFQVLPKVKLAKGQDTAQYFVPVEQGSGSRSTYVKGYWATVEFKGDQAVLKEAAEFNTGGWGQGAFPGTDVNDLSRRAAEGNKAAKKALGKPIAATMTMDYAHFDPSRSKPTRSKNNGIWSLVEDLGDGLKSIVTKNDGFFIPMMHEKSLAPERRNFGVHSGGKNAMYDARSTEGCASSDPENIRNWADAQSKSAIAWLTKNGGQMGKEGDRLKKWSEWAKTNGQSPELVKWVKGGMKGEAPPMQASTTGAKGEGTARVAIDQLYLLKNMVEKAVGNTVHIVNPTIMNPNSEQYRQLVSAKGGTPIDTRSAPVQYAAGARSAAISDVKLASAETISPDDLSRVSKALDKGNYGVLKKLDAEKISAFNAATKKISGVAVLEKGARGKEWHVNEDKLKTHISESRKRQQALVKQGKLNPEDVDGYIGVKTVRAAGGSIDNLKPPTVTKTKAVPVV
jgi:hypothetical protein